MWPFATHFHNQLISFYSAVAHGGIGCHKARLVQNMAFSNQPCGGRPVWPGQPFLAARKKHKKIGTLRVTWPVATSRLGSERTVILAPEK